MTLADSFYNTCATVTVVIHALWIGWVVAGVFIARMAAWLRAVHLSCALVTLVIAATRGLCPLTDLEVWLLEQAGQSGYDGGFVQHYAAEVVYCDAGPATPAILMILTMLIAAVAVVRQWGGRLGSFTGGEQTTVKGISRFPSSFHSQRE